MRARECFLNYIFRIFVNRENGAGDHVSPLLVHTHQDSECRTFTCAGSLNHLPFFITITRGNRQALSPLSLIPISLGRLGIQLAGAEKEGYATVQKKGSVGAHQRGAQQGRDCESSPDLGGVFWKV